MLNLLKQFTGTAIMCEKCGSKHVGYSDVRKATTPFDEIEIHYDVQCKKCKAKGRIIEVWE